MELDNFFTHGFVLFEEPNAHERADFYNFLAEKYLGQIFPSWELVEVSYSEAVVPEDRITVWHNDSKFGMNVTFLYYMDDMSPDVGGSISIRNGLYEKTIYPKAGTLIMLSQQPNVQHKAEYSTVRRRMYNIDYKVTGL